MQIEILQHRLLGAGPGDEDQPPDGNEMNPGLFDFFSYGQPNNGANAGGGNPVNNQHEGYGPAPQWGLWPNGPATQANAPFIGPQLPPNVPVIQALPAQGPPVASMVVCNWILI